MKCANQNLHITTGVFYGFKLHKTGHFHIEDVKMSLISNTKSETQFFVAWHLVYFILTTESFKQLALAFNDSYS